MTAVDAQSAQGRRRRLLGLAGWLALTFTAAAIGARASIGAQSVYAELSQPPWAPPGWLFGPVWTALYALMAIAAWLVFSAHGFAAARGALVLFIVQLVFNALWSWLFFAWRRGALAFADVLILWCLIAATLIAFWRLSKVAGALLVPYLGWVTFAAMLTFAVWRRNPATLG